VLLPAKHGAADDLNKESKMPRVSLNQPAPNFSLPDFAANMISLSDFRDRKNVLLVFNRGFA
jgi:peroxiredoxin